MQDDAPDKDDDPIGHLVQFADPIVSEYVPSEQNEQGEPRVDEYDPFAQGVHDDAADRDDDPMGHFVHLTDPVEFV